MKANQKFRAPDAHANAGGAAIAVGFAILIVGLLLTSTVVNFVNNAFASLTGNGPAQNLVNNVPIFWIIAVVLIGLGLIGAGAWQMVKAHKG